MDVVDVLDHKRVPVNREERAKRVGDVPYYGAAGQVGWIDDYIFDDELVLLGEDGVQFLDSSAKKAYVVRGKSWVNNHAHVLRPKRDVVTSEFLCNALNIASYEGLANGTTRLKLTKAAMGRMQIAVPSLEEQQRVTGWIQSQRQEIYSSGDDLKEAANLLHRFELAAYHEAFAMDWPTPRLDEVAEVRLGRQRSPKNHAGPNMRPYLRAANVTWGGLNLDDVKEMNFDPSEVETYRLIQGDIVVAEASGSATEVGKPAMWRDEIDECCFQNTLIRVRVGPQMCPEFVLAFIRYLALSGKFAQVSGGVGMNHLGRKILAEWPIPTPPRAVQEETIARLETILSAARTLRTEVEAQRSAAQTLLRAVIMRGMSGALGERT